MPWGVSIYFFMAIPKGRLSSYVVGHVVGEHDREFYESGYFSVATPGGLVDYFALTVFLDGIGIAFARGKHVPDFGFGCLGVAVEKILADQIAMLGECLARFAVHIQYYAVLITYRNGTVEPLSPLHISHFHISLHYYRIIASRMMLDCFANDFTYAIIIVCTFIANPIA